MAGVLYIRDPETGEFVPVPTLVGPPGPGVPAGGAAGQVLVKSGEADYAAEWRENDASKLGGKGPEYYAPVFNELDNSDFTRFIAQAGIGGAHGTQAYAGDRWILVSGTVTGSANANGDGYSGIVLNGTIRQILASPPAVATVAVGMISGSAQITYADGAVEITSNGGTLKWALLYEGAYTADTLPPYVPKGYAAELAECQRYFERIGWCSGPYHASVLLAVTDTGDFRVLQSYSQPKRKFNPTILLNGAVEGQVVSLRKTSDDSICTGTFALWHNVFFERLNVIHVDGGTSEKGNVYEAYIDVCADL